MTGNKDGGRYGNEDEYGKEHEGRDGGENGSGNGGENIEEGRGEREPRNLQSGNRGESEDVQEGATPTNNQQSQPQDPTPQRDRRIMQRIRAQGREARGKIEEGGGEAKKRKKPQESYRRDVRNGGNLCGRRKNVDKKVLVLQ